MCVECIILSLFFPVHYNWCGNTLKYAQMFIYPITALHSFVFENILGFMEEAKWEG